MHAYTPRARNTKLQKTGKTVLDMSKEWWFYLPLGWVWSVYVVSDEEFLAKTGLDAYVFLRFCKFCADVAAFASVLAVVLCSVYSAAADDSNSDIAPWDRLTMIPLKIDSSRLWCSAVAAYILTGYFCHKVYKEWENFVEKKHFVSVHGSNEDVHSDQTHHSIIIEVVYTSTGFLLYLVFCYSINAANSILNCYALHFTDARLVNTI